MEAYGFLQFGGEGDRLFHSVAATLEDLLRHSPDAKRHVLEKVPLSVFERKDALVKHLRGMCARQLQKMEWAWILDYFLQAEVRERYGRWTEGWSPKTLLRTKTS